MQVNNSNPSFGMSNVKITRAAKRDIIEGNNLKNLLEQIPGLRKLAKENKVDITLRHFLNHHEENQLHCVATKPIPWGMNNLITHLYLDARSLNGSEMIESHSNFIRAAKNAIAKLQERIVSKKGPSINTQIETALKK